MQVFLENRLQESLYSEPNLIFGAKFFCMWADFATRRKRGVESPEVGGLPKEGHEMRFGVRGTLPDPDPVATQEWVDSILAVRDQIGEEEARRLLLSTVDAARNAGVEIDVVNTPYMNTLHPDQQGAYPGDLELETRLHGINRWNAMMVVTRGNKNFDGIGGHISTYASASHAWEIGFNHFFRGKDGAGQGDHLYWQGHASPGIYARAWLEGRLTHEQMEAFRQETGGNGLSSYPHPRLMPDFWEFPSVSMGLGAMTAIHQARFNRYLEDRGLVSTANSRVWYTMGDGESDEPESLSQLSLAGREGLDNIVMTMNCNLQRLDGPVRGTQRLFKNSKAASVAQVGTSSKCCGAAVGTIYSLETPKGCSQHASIRWLMAMSSAL